MIIFNFISKYFIAILTKQVLVKSEIIIVVLQFVLAARHIIVKANSFTMYKNAFTKSTKVITMWCAMMGSLYNTHILFTNLYQ